MRDNWALLEADFHREYGEDLDVIWTDPHYSWRRFAVRVAGLSPNSRFVRAPYRESDPVVSERIVESALM